MKIAATQQGAVSQPKIGRVFGNAEVVAMVERWLEAAKKGNMTYCAILGVLHPQGEVIYDYCGPADVESHMPMMLDEWKKAVTEQVINIRQPPAADPELDPSYVCFNCCMQPLSYDTIVWLIAAEMHRRRHNAPSPLKVGFWAGKSGTMGLEDPVRNGFLVNVTRPALKLLRAVEDPKAVRGRVPATYPLREIIEAYERGEEIPKFKPIKVDFDTIGSWLPAPPITITLRETVSWPHRNSNIEAWLKFGAWLRDQGEDVIFIRDTAKATEPLPGFSTCPQASVYLGVRVALYQYAKANLFVSNGPVELAHFMDRPWLSLTRLYDTSEFLPETRRWRELNGLSEKGFPWNTKAQQEIFCGDSYEEIRSAWDAFSKEL